MATFSFVLGLIFIRLLRKSITDEANISSASTSSLEVMPMQAYNAVIQQLKQQKQELQEQSHADLQRARASENLSQSVLATLPCGLIVFGSNGIVKSCNPAAKQILGFASATGMSADDLFRGSVITNRAEHPADNPDAPVCVADEIPAVLRSPGARAVETEFELPSGERKYLGVSFSALSGADGAALGVACTIQDFTELHTLRQQVAPLAAAAAAGS